LSGISLGARVLVKRELAKSFDGAVSDAKALKSRSPFVGPFLVTQDMGRGNWRVAGLEKLKKVDPVFHESNLKLLVRHESAVPRTPGLKHMDMFWPDDTRRVQEVVEKRSLHGFTQYRVKFIGGMDGDPGTWLALNQLHLFDQQKILDFVKASARPSQPRTSILLDGPVPDAVSLRA
jgi:hypothetical protein